MMPFYYHNHFARLLALIPMMLEVLTTTTRRRARKKATLDLGNVQMNQRLSTATTCAMLTIRRIAQMVLTKMKRSAKCGTATQVATAPAMGGISLMGMTMAMATGTGPQLPSHQEKAHRSLRQLPPPFSTATMISSAATMVCSALLAPGSAMITLIALMPATRTGAAKLRHPRQAVAMTARKVPSVDTAAKECATTATVAMDP